MPSARSEQQPDSDTVLRRDAKRLYETRVKPALKSSLLDTNPSALLGGNDYVVHVQDNLLAGLGIAAIENEFNEGEGDELEDKMRSPWSSSALAVNSFLPWRIEDEPLHLLGLGPFAPSFAFEAKCPNGVSRIPSHLDVLLRTETAVVGIESKCTEPVQGRVHPAVSASYLSLADRGDVRASSRWFAALAKTPEFCLLDGYQLIKHYLGLRKTFPDQSLTLVYLYWEPLNADSEPVFCQHRAEVARFAALVTGDETCGFVHASYSDLWREWAGMALAPDWLRTHVELLKRRYEIRV